MPIKSLKELTKLRKSLHDTIDLRESGLGKLEKTEILVGMATCGIASGAKETYDLLNKLISEKNIKNVDVISVGCIGYCSQEPTLQVCKPGKEPVLYGKITEDKAEDFLEKVIINDGDLPDSHVIMSFSKVVN